MGVYIDDKLALDLAEAIDSKMSHYQYNPRGADHTCLFCRREMGPKEYDIKHAEDCDGVRFLRALRG